MITSAKTFFSPLNLVKYRSCEIECYNDPITMKFDRHFGSAAAEVPVKFQSDWKSLNLNYGASRHHEILWWKVDRCPGFDYGFVLHSSQWSLVSGTIFSFRLYETYWFIFSEMKIKNTHTCTDIIFLSSKGVHKADNALRRVHWMQLRESDVKLRNVVRCNTDISCKFQFDMLG